MPLAPGMVLNNRYRVVQLLGQGGFGAVYRVWDRNLERPVALKENLDASLDAQRQFKREAQMLFDLNHPGLPRVFDHFSIPGQGQYLVMEFVEGDDLFQHMKFTGRPLVEGQVLVWAGQVCEALAYLHSHNPPIIHRDIKPGNIKITPDGWAKLVDFGIAKVYDPHLRTTLGARAVTPGYSPPEQYGMGATDARTDLYALGATLYYLLTAYEPPESIQRSLGEGLPSLRSINPAVSWPVENAILKAMAVQPADRFASAAELRSALLGPQSTPPAAPAMGEPVQVTRTQVISAAATSAAVTGGATGTAPVPSPAAGIPATVAAPRPSAPVYPRPTATVPVTGALDASLLKNPWKLGLVLVGLALAFFFVIGGAIWLGARAARRQAPPPTPAVQGAPAIEAPTRLSTQSRPTAARPATRQPTQPPLATNTPYPTNIPLPTPLPPRPTEPPPAPPPPLAPVAPVLVLEGAYYCRGGPGTGYDQIWSFAAGTRLDIIGRGDNGWWLVQFQDNRTSHDRCWISGGSLQGDISDVPYSNFVTVK